MPPKPKYNLFFPGWWPSWLILCTDIEWTSTMMLLVNEWTPYKVMVGIHTIEQACEYGSDSWRLKIGMHIIFHACAWQYMQHCWLLTNMYCIGIISTSWYLYSHKWHLKDVLFGTHLYMWNKTNWKESRLNDMPFLIEREEKCHNPITPRFAHINAFTLFLINLLPCSLFYRNHSHLYCLLDVRNFNTCGLYIVNYMPSRQLIVPSLTRTLQDRYHNHHTLGVSHQHSPLVKGIDWVQVLATLQGEN